MTTNFLKNLSAFQMEKHKALGILLAFCLGWLACMALNHFSAAKTRDSGVQSHSSAQLPVARFEVRTQVDAPATPTRSGNLDFGDPAAAVHPQALVLAGRRGGCIQIKPSLVSLGVRLQI